MRKAGDLPLIFGLPDRLLTDTKYITRQATSTSDYIVPHFHHVRHPMLHVEYHWRESTTWYFSVAYISSSFDPFLEQVKLYWSLICFTLPGSNYPGYAVSFNTTYRSTRLNSLLYGQERKCHAAMTLIHMTSRRDNQGTPDNLLWRIMWRIMGKWGGFWNNVAVLK